MKQIELSEEERNKRLRQSIELVELNEFNKSKQKAMKKAGLIP